MTHPLLGLQKLGQSPWHDNIRRDLLTSGALRKMVRAGDITGLTSNPTIFEQAIGGSRDYDADLGAMARKGLGADAIFDVLAIDDIRAAADVFAPVFRKSRGADGHVSIEVSPRLARDTQATIREAKRLWKAVNRPNLMIKIPATKEGIPAIRQSIADGLNVNVTLIFSLERYAEVIDAYIEGLEIRQRTGKPIGGIASVASFFVSRVDTAVDKQLGEKIASAAGEEKARLEGLPGQAAIANAKLAYRLFREKFATGRFEKLAHRGARVQRPLWASTSTKNPKLPDVYYVEALVGPDTVDTMPPATIAAYKDHGNPERRLDRDLDGAAKMMARLAAAGIRMDEVTRKLEEEGVASFAKSFDSLIRTVSARREAVLLGDRETARLGGTAKGAAAAAAALDAAKFGERLWKKDPTLWKPEDAKHQAEIRIRLGWLDVIDAMKGRVAELRDFADEVRKAGFTHALLCGMGGSSLAPEVLRLTFGVKKGFLDLAVLDSTDPAAVRAAERRSNPAKTLYIISSKSGGTTEPNAFLAYFRDRVKSVRGEKAGASFVAITDPDTPMERRARELGFRKVFLNPPDIGGRYSALSLFGLVPAALMGHDVAKLLARAERMRLACAASVPAADNPGLRLGAAMGAAAKSGRDKVTLLVPPKLASFGAWAEQLIAESTGKEGKGILPVEGEAPGAPKAYGKDRLFVSLSIGRDRNRAAAKLAAAGHPVVELRLDDAWDLAGEFLRWEIATAAAGRVLEIDPFDQPNVQESKDNTARLLKEHAAQGRLPDGGGAGGALAPTDGDFGQRLRQHLESAKPADYVALTAYLAPTPAREKILRALQAEIRDRRRVAVTLGWGPRFLHSTGQLHKGGADSGVFVQFTADDAEDLPVPGESYTFGVLKSAQALGDYQSLASRGRRILRVRLGRDVEEGLRKALAAVKTPAKAGARVRV